MNTHKDAKSVLSNQMARAGLGNRPMVAVSSARFCVTAALS
jgi:hypothetical protein